MQMNVHAGATLLARPRHRVAVIVLAIMAMLVSTVAVQAATTGTANAAGSATSAAAGAMQTCGSGWTQIGSTCYSCPSGYTLRTGGSVACQSNWTQCPAGFSYYDLYSCRRYVGTYYPIGAVYTYSGTVRTTVGPITKPLPAPSLFWATVDVVDNAASGFIDNLSSAETNDDGVFVPLFEETTSVMGTTLSTGFGSLYTGTVDAFSTRPAQCLVPITGATGTRTFSTYSAYLLWAACAVPTVSCYYVSGWAWCE